MVQHQQRPRNKVIAIYGICLFAIFLESLPGAKRREHLLYRPWHMTILSSKENNARRMIKERYHAILEGKSV